MKFKRKLSGILAALMLLSSVSYGAGAAETEAVTENINTAETETTTDTEIETDDTPVVKTLEFPVDVPEESTQTSQIYDYGLCDYVKDGVILHAFCWSFNTITANMADIAAAGYTAVQTSPPNKCNASHPNLKLMGDDLTDGTDGCWWWHYQPVDWKIGNYQLGTKQDYVDMCAKADEYGIKIIADVVPNHTTPHLNEVSDDLVNAVGGARTYDLNGDCTKISKLYHTNGFNPITKPATRFKTIFYQFGGLDDVNTENRDYQAYFVKYLNELVDAGCDGLRYDTAKNIGVFSDPKEDDNANANDFWDVATGQKSVTNSQGETVRFNKPEDFFIYAEILQGDGIPYIEYSKYMSMVASNYGNTLRTAINSNNFKIGDSEGYIKNVNNPWEHSLSADKLVSWVESHDNYINNDTYNWIDNTEVKLAWAALAARKETTPLFYNRPKYSSTDDKWGKNSNKDDANTIGTTGNDDWSDPQVAEVNKFRNAMVGQPETLRNISDGNGTRRILQIDRGELGTCIINLNKDKDVPITDQDTTMADGVYKDTVSGNVFTVSNGKISGTLNRRSVHTIYAPVVLKASNNNAVFTTDSYDVKLSASGIKAGTQPTYTVTVDGNTTQSGTFLDGQKIDVGSGVNAVGTSKNITLTLSATYKVDNEHDVNVTKTFNYEKRDLRDVTYIYIDTSTYNWSTPSVYVYSESGSSTVSNHAWPGEIMTPVPGTDYYKYEVPSNLKNASVIFYAAEGSGTTYRYPANGNAGLPLNGKTMLFSANQSWSVFDPESIITEEIEPEIEESSGDRYVYYFNSLGRTGNIYAKLTNSKTSAATTKQMNLNEDLQCYYCSYKSTLYDTVSFTDNAEKPIKTNAVTIKPGRIFVATSRNAVYAANGDIASTTENGEWIPFNNLYQHKIYFDAPTNCNDVNITLWKGTKGKEATATGGMTQLGSSTIGTNLYCYTYCYAKLNNMSNSDFTSVEFSYNNTVTSAVVNQVSSDKIDSYIYVYNTSGNTPALTPLPAKDSQKKTQVKLHYYDTQITPAGDPVIIRNNKNTGVDDKTAEGAVFSQTGSLKNKNMYNELKGYTTQFDFVKNLANSYGANISPSKFIHKSDYFSGIGETYSDSGIKWITYYLEGTEIPYEQLDPGLTNIDTIEVYLWAKAKTYKVDFIYPTSANESLLQFTDINGNELSYANSKTVKLHSQKRYYNENISSDTSPIITDMETPSGKEFDGWYCLDLSASPVKYYKITSFEDFNCRVTSDLTLYAVFRNANVENKPGATTTTSGIDDLTDDSGVKHRINTIMNIYNLEKGNRNITNVGIAFVRYESSVSNYNISNVKTYLKNNVISGNKTINGDGGNFAYDYYTYSTTNVKLTSMNRAQFIIEKTNDDIITTGGYCNVVAFTTFKVGENWYISDNYVVYNYDSDLKTLDYTVKYATN